MCIDLQGAVRSALAGRLAAAPRMIGEDQPREWAARWLFGERVRTQGVHVIEQAVEVCAAVAGEPLAPILPPLPVNREAELWADGVLRGAGDRPVILLSPGAGWGAKRWPAERYGAVARDLQQQGCMVLVNAGPQEQAIAAEVVRASGGVAQAPEFTLERLIALTRRVCLVIAGDTGTVAPGLCAGQAGRGHLWAHRPQPERPLRGALPRASPSRKQARPHPARGARGRLADHHSRAGRRGSNGSATGEAMTLHTDLTEKTGAPRFAPAYVGTKTMTKCFRRFNHR